MHAPLQIGTGARADQAQSQRGVSVLALALLGVATAVGVLFVALSLIDVDVYSDVIAEDGPVEYGSSLLWFAAATLSLATLVLVHLRRAKRPSRVQLVLYLLMILFFIVAGGEEISWGQRLIGYEPPEELLEVNKQREANLHNIGSISIYANTFFLLTLGVFVIAPILLARSRRLRDFTERHQLPVVDPRATQVYLIVLAVWVFLGARFGTLGFHPFSLWDHYTQMDDEVFELGAAYAFASLSVWDLARRLTESRSTASRGALGEPIEVPAGRRHL
jgi:amino acid transporter